MKKTAWLKSCIKKDVSSQGETKRYLVGLCENRYVKRHVSMLVKHSKLGAKISIKFARKLFKMHKNGFYRREFKKISGKHTLGPSEAFFFLFLNLLQINSPEKNYASKDVEIWGPFLKKISDYASDMKIF